MNNKIFNYLFLMKIKYIFLNILFIGIFVEIINLLEIAKIIEKDNLNVFLIFYLSLLKLPSIIIEIIPFVIVISTAFIYRYLINNNELISMRNIGHSIIDVYKPIGLAILMVGILVLTIINPISAKFEEIFNDKTSKDFSNMYSINIKNNELWIKNIKGENEKYFIHISNIDLENMNAENIKIILINDINNLFYSAKNGKFDGKNFILNDVIIFDVKNDNYKKNKSIILEMNFNNQDLTGSILNYKFIPFYQYQEHLNSLKKFNLYSSEISLYYLSEILKPFFLVAIGFVVMGFSGKFKRNENFFKVLFISILIGFLIFLLKEIITSITISYSIPFILSYIIIFSLPILIGLYQTINIETK
ncbi:MAG: hypothetical protein CFH17_00216 [Alphaproteobacteria bacterium MarineAlpha5_Bin7]|nr:MAG: hypothetical protein CFH17_00216 [Alphaproteobacteria bacterium MarineAlpha5_Bin7]|tara:strand:+ start:961 stop:2043 length:1083 start_codon:yes stop_codon:yes gene_type:complete